jgi:hypothetical protein
MDPRSCEKLGTVQTANLLLRWNDSLETWTFVATLREEVEQEYWKRKPAFRQTSDEDLFFALNKYAAVGRFEACLGGVRATSAELRRRITIIWDYADFEVAAATGIGRRSGVVFPVFGAVVWKRSVERVAADFGG